MILDTQTNIEKSLGVLLCTVKFSSVLYHIVIIQQHWGPNEVLLRIYCYQYSTLKYNAVQYSAMQSSTLQFITVHYSTGQYSTGQYSTVQYGSVPVLSEYHVHPIVPKNTKLYHKSTIILFSTVLHSAMMYTTMMYSTLMYSSERYLG